MESSAIDAFPLTLPSPPMGERMKERGRRGKLIFYYLRVDQ
jgi:hypothetical protein